MCAQLTVASNQRLSELERRGGGGGEEGIFSPHTFQTFYFKLCTSEFGVNIVPSSGLAPQMASCCTSARLKSGLPCLRTGCCTCSRKPSINKEATAQ